MSKFTDELTKHNRISIQEEIKERLDEESYKDFQEALGSRSVSASVIVSVLKSFNVEVSENTIRRWRNEITPNV